MECTKKNGLTYTDNFKVIVALDSENTDFNGTIPNGSYEIKEKAFYNCSLKKIFVPDSVKILGERCFSSSLFLQEVRLPLELKKIPSYCFSGCSALKKVVMPLEVEDFSEGLFEGCSSLEEIPFRAGIKTLPKNVFAFCSSLKSIVIPPSVTKICSGSLASCKSLTTLVLPEKLEILEDGWISDCPLLRHIRISEENPFFKTNEENSVLYKIENGNEIPVLSLENTKNSEIPGLKEPDTENSIITFEDTDDALEYEDDILNPENKEKDKIDIEVDEKTFMQNLFFETQKVVQQNTENNGEKRILFVFAENIVQTPLGQKFSKKLTDCCIRLSKIHNFSSIFYFYGTRLDNEKFKTQFINFMKEKDIVFASNAENLSELSENQVTLCSYLNISLLKKDILTEGERAKNPNVKPLKLLINDVTESL